ncbi:MAG: transmembrane amino acid transporter protein-domain-containing protein [Monoraphidium minutum]|nr:MAG: transmembrane amino acid transporter protein-domain-containing protein [Monoraphidium minutum]
MAAGTGGLHEPLLPRAAPPPPAGAQPPTPPDPAAAAGHPVALVLEEDGSPPPRGRRHSFGGGGGGEDAPRPPPADTYRICVFNLTKVILGAGMMAVPRALYLLGVIPGTALMAAIALLTHFTLARGLVWGAAAAGAKGSYGDLARRALGRRGEAALQLAVFVNCWTMLVIFLVISGDLLVGDAPDYYGLIRQLTGAAPGSPALNRPLVLGALCCAVLLPLGSMRSMERLAAVNIIGVMANAFFAGLMVVLAASAAAAGAAAAPPLWPQWGELERGGGGGRLGAAAALAATLPVVLNCFVCHQSLHPLLPSLRPYSTTRAQSMVATSLAAAGGLYYIIAICAVAAFGSDLRDDVLSNITAAAMAPLLRSLTAARAAALAVRAGYLLSIAGSFTLLLFPLRHVIADVALGGHDALARRWLPVSAALIASAAATAAALPSIWGALALVGATATTAQAWIVPALIILSLERAAARRERSGGGEAGGLAGGKARASGAARAAAVGRSCVAWLILLLGAGMFANAVLGEAARRLLPRAGPAP